MKMILLIDNYDSFTYNLQDYVRRFYEDVKVVRNDSPELKKINWSKVEGIIISPGPGIPEQAGQTLKIIKRFFREKPILGVCLGHQAIARTFGAKIIKAKIPMHGKTTLVAHDGKGVFRKIPTPLSVMRYHSLIIDKKTLPKEFEISSETEDGEIMGIRHKKFSLEGLQFHPEAVLTEHGERMIENWIDTLRITNTTELRINMVRHKGTSENDKRQKTNLNPEYSGPMTKIQNTKQLFFSVCLVI